MSKPPALLPDSLRIAKLQYRGSSSVLPFKCSPHSIASRMDPCTNLSRASLYADLVKQIRSGSTDQLPQFDYLVYIGNSYGSVLGVYIAQTYPDLFNMSVFTGYTKRILPSYYGIALQNPQPADAVFPGRFPDANSTFYVRTTLYSFCHATCIPYFSLCSRWNRRTKAPRS